MNFFYNQNHVKCMYQKHMTINVAKTRFNKTMNDRYYFKIPKSLLSILMSFIPNHPRRLRVG